MRSLITLTIFVISTLTFSAEADSKILRGQWGGEGVSIWATSGGADADLYCSMGRISGPIVLDDDGHFCVVGTINYYDGTPPIKQLPATYIGQVTGKVMILTVNMPDREPWHFELRKGELGQVYKCAE